MHGQVKFELFELDGTPKSTVEKSNTILPIVEEFFNKVTALYNMAGGTYEDDYQGLVKLFSGSSVFKAASFYGLALYPAALPITPGAFMSKYKPYAYAGGVLATPTAVMGTFVSGTAILDANSVQIGVRMIWRFPGVSANGTLGALALTQREYTYTTTGVRGYSTGSTIRAWPFHNAGAHTVNFLDNTNLATFAAGVLTVAKKQVSLTATGAVSIYDTQTLLNFITYPTTYKIIDDPIANQYITIVKDNVANLYLIKINKTTGVVDTSINISVAKSLSFHDFGLCGNFVVLLSRCTSGAVPTTYVVNLANNTYVTLAIPAAIDDAYPLRNMMTYRTIEGDYCCDINHSSNMANSRFVEVYAKPDGTGVEFGVHQMSGIINMSIANFGTSPIGLVQMYDTNYSQSKLLLGIARRALFSICNLDTPIVKTDSDILQVTYDLTWA